MDPGSLTKRVCISYCQDIGRLLVIYYSHKIVLVMEAGVERNKVPGGNDVEEDILELNCTGRIPSPGKYVSL